MFPQGPSRYRPRKEGPAFDKCVVLPCFIGTNALEYTPDPAWSQCGFEILPAVHDEIGFLRALRAAKRGVDIVLFDSPAPEDFAEVLSDQRGKLFRALAVTYETPASCDLKPDLYISKRSSTGPYTDLFNAADSVLRRVDEITHPELSTIHELGVAGTALLMLKTPWPIIDTIVDLYRDDIRLVGRRLHLEEVGLCCGVALHDELPSAIMRWKGAFPFEYWAAFDMEEKDGSPLQRKIEVGQANHPLLSSFPLACAVELAAQTRSVLVYPPVSPGDEDAFSAFDGETSSVAAVIVAPAMHGDTVVSVLVGYSSGPLESELSADHRGLILALGRVYGAVKLTHRQTSR